MKEVKMQIKRLIGKRVAVKSLNPEIKNSGTIILPEISKAGVTYAEITHIAPELADVLAVGSRVIYDRYAGVDISDRGDRSSVILMFDDVMAVVE